jgi:hypothetical protein
VVPDRSEHSAATVGHLMSQADVGHTFRGERGRSAVLQVRAPQTHVPAMVNDEPFEESYGEGESQVSVR